MYSIGVDIGGTQCKIAIVNKSNVVLKKVIDTPTDGIEKVVHAIAKAIDELVIDNEIKGIGVGVRGTFKDGKLNDRILKAEDTDLEGLFNKFFPNSKIVVTNDANAAAVAELKYGQLKGSKAGLLITLGTGIGGGIVIDGKLYEGANKNAGEIGRMISSIDDIDIYNEETSTYESFASTTALVNKARDILKNNSEYNDSIIKIECKNDLNRLNAKNIFDAYDKNDKLAHILVKKHIEYITSGIINLITVFDLDKIVISGGISKRSDIIINGIKEILDSKNLTILKTCNIVISKFLNDAGVIGAANLII